MLKTKSGKRCGRKISCIAGCKFYCYQHAGDQYVKNVTSPNKKDARPEVTRSCNDAMKECTKSCKNRN